MMATLTDQQMLDDAAAKYHKLVTGAQAVEVDFGTHRAKFAVADANKLKNYIQQIEDKIAGATRIGAIGIVF
jgi:predicted house-cleaning NTP pyrophosphatase (Maf/HAM1 superfamily)